MRIALLTVLLASTLLAQNAQQDPQVTSPEWVCTFSLKGDKPTDPVVHVHVLVRGRTEGDASIRANTYVQGFMRDEGKLQFLEAALKPK